MKITCLIVEDEPLARNLMVAYVEKVPYLHLLKACSNPLDAIDFLRDNAVDLLFPRKQSSDYEPRVHLQRLNKLFSYQIYD